LDGGCRVTDRVERELDRGGEQCRVDEDRDRVDEAEGGDTAGGERVSGAQQAVEPRGGKGLGEDDEQFACDAGAGQRFVLDQVGQRRGGVVGRKELRPDEQETE
jgi:hypothetical protein